MEHILASCFFFAGWGHLSVLSCGVSRQSCRSQWGSPTCLRVNKLDSLSISPRIFSWLCSPGKTEVNERKWKHASISSSPVSFAPIPGAEASYRAQSRVCGRALQSCEESFLQSISPHVCGFNYEWLIRGLGQQNWEKLGTQHDSTFTAPVLPFGFLPLCSRPTDRALYGYCLPYRIIFLKDL